MNPYQNLAKKTVEEYIKNHKIIEPPSDLPQEFFNSGGRKGIFVTIHNGKELRGCIGTYLPLRENLAREIIENASTACSLDTRFSPITAKELPELSYEISLLDTPQPVSDVEKLNPQKYGIIVSCADGRSGLLLPGLDGIDTPSQQLSIACQKGDIDPARDQISVQAFTVTKY